MKNLLNKIISNQGKIHAWLSDYEGSKELPLYSSVDIRDAGFKIAVVDTNIFPAGFNNLCEHGIGDAIKTIKAALVTRVPDCRNVLIIAEEHTRNTWYLENVRMLGHIIREAGFQVRVATFLNIQPKVCEDCNYVELETATGKTLKVYSIERVVKDIKAGSMKPDIIIMNNDLTKGIPEILKGSDTPIYPSIQAGWHSRQKSHHFQHTADLMKEFATILDFDPWHFTCLDAVVEQVNINEEQDRIRMADQTSQLFEQIKTKYQEHGIDEKPFVFIKADSGTYGMGVLAVENPQQIINLNRKDKNKLFRGKGSQINSRYLLQEGVPTSYNIDNRTGEVCIYQIANQFVGGFYRVHGEKSNRENLNSKGMEFKKMCPRLDKYGECGIRTDPNMFDVYRILARIAGIASHREIIQLEKVANA